MATIVTQPGVITTQTVTISQGPRWTTGMCDCCEDCGICCCAFWCFPCMQCSTASEFGECFCLPLIDGFLPLTLMGFLGCSGVCPPVTMAMRAAVRERYSIKGSICDDCVRACFCYTCTWCQMAREIKRRSMGSMVTTTAQTTILSNVPMLPQGHDYAPLMED
ncbi:placenta-specific gene 8 protein-like [Gastrophryne carolinensis]